MFACDYVCICINADVSVGVGLPDVSVGLYLSASGCDYKCLQV